ncbi:alpha/beta hydrolase [Aspergillus japonicus CBS 114.51]|uniref:Alpha/beta hydrolase n=1 Tax=Aspergillus japonicus CBS 114.51 TaxID=1448312 RepID=A0A8T8XFJ5_ASPJA|nr:alpha/beta hydrolase [Aspergillus japonicus CBS 114.51]RAH86594.1 alpha/beta hydrolase [Aspergillus japonicus CBS 114.51]
MAAQQSITVPHLGGIEVGYALSNNNTYDPSKPTCVLINSMCMTVSLYRPQFEDAELTSTTNLLAIEPLGHGATRCLAPAAEHFTYWDSAIMALQVMEKLGIQKAFALGTSQGGWVVARMALLAPDRILGILPLGTSMDYESADSRSKDCWDPVTLLTPFLEKWSSETPTPDFVVDDVWCGMVAGIGFGASATPETTDFWVQTLKQVYTGDEGRKKVRMALMCLLTRDGLLLRLRDVRCPVYWLQGTEDFPFKTTVPAEQIQRFSASKEAKLQMVEGGAHYLNATHPREVNAAIREMVARYGA